MPIDSEPRAVSDPARLAALDDMAILDTPAEQGFDDIVHLAAQACRTPVALVSLVAADRQWFKANVGFPRCETDLDSSVCAHALGEPDLLVIPDLAADPRTALNPLVTGEPFIRFYAGAPLRTAAGATLGSLCVIDRVPRPEGLATDQADTLRRLARQVMTQLDLRRALAERDRLLDEQRALLRERGAYDRTQQGISRSGGDLDAILEVLVEGALQAVPSAEAAIMELVDGDDLEYRAVRGSIAQHRGLRIPLRGSLAGHCVRTNAAARVDDVLADGRVRQDFAETLGLRSAIVVPVSRGDAVLGVLKLQSNEPAAFSDRDLDLARLFAGLATAGLAEAGAAATQRALLESEARYRAIFDSATDYAIVVMDLDGRVTNWNSGAERILGWTAGEMAGRTVEAIFTPEDRAADVPGAEMRSALASGRGTDERWHLRRSGERFFAQGEMMALRFDGGEALGFVKILRDHTEQERLQDRLRASEKHNAGLVDLGDRLRDLSAAAETTLAASAVLGDVLGVDLVGYGIVDPTAETITVERDWTANGAASLAGTLRFRDFGSYIDDLKRDETVVVTDARTDPRTAAHAAALEARGARAFVNMPVFERGAFVGLLYVSTRRPRGWTDEELAFVREVADRVRIGLARVEAEQRQHLLNQELSHRLKNTLAMVQAIAAQTLRGIAERDAVEAFKNRIAALGKAHDILLQQSWTAAPIQAVIEAMLALHVDRSRFVIVGPGLNLGPKTVLSLTLLLHELATNATKYGALSVPDGLVRLAWAVEDGSPEPEVAMTWSEEGGPPAVEPTRRGFGSRLIRMGLAGTGNSTMRYTPTGLQAEFRASLNVVTDQ